MNRHLSFFLIFLFTLTFPASSYAENDVPASVLDFTLKLADEKPVSLDSFKGKVLLLVNVASKCGFTGQYEGLEKLQKNTSLGDFRF